MTQRTLKASTAALLSTSALFALAAPAAAQSLNVPGGSTYTLAADEAADTLTGVGTVNLYDYVLTIGADGSSSTFDGDIIAQGPTTYAGSWLVMDGPFWPGSIPTNGVEAAALLFGGTAGDYRVSTVDSNVANIDDLAWYDGYGIYPAVKLADDFVADVDGDGTYSPGDYSAYVSDHGAAQINYAFSAAVGIGGLTKVGGGTLTLAGTGNWIGQTQVLGGTLQGTTNSISGGSILVDGGQLFYSQAFSGLVAQDISGSGVVTAFAPGQTLTFAGDLTNGRLNVGSDTTIELQGTNNFTETAGVWVANNGVLRLTEGASASASEIGVLGSGEFMTLDNQGSITGTAYYGVNPFSGMITNGAAGNADALISGGHTGIIGGGSLTVDNYGQIQGGTNDGINAWGGSLALTNDSGAVIYGAGTSGGSNGYGAVASGALSGSNDGSILGRYAGMTSRGYLDFTNNGLIGSGSFDASNNFVYSNGNDGVQILGGGTLTNSATGQILGSISGVYTQAATATIDNSGLIQGQHNGIYADSDLSVTNMAGATISGSDHGIQFNRAYNTLDNSGSVVGGVLLTQANAALDATNDAGAVIVNTNGAGLQTASGTSLTLDNAGDVVGTSGGIDAEGTANSITNSGRIAAGMLSGGTITTNGNTALIMRGGTLGNLAGGEIRGGWGVAAYGGASVTNAGTIAGTDEGLYLGLGGTVTNSGTISGGNGAWYLRGVLVQNANGSVTNQAGGTISGGRGVDFEGVGGTLDNAGTITGAVDGVTMSGAGTVTNRVGGAINGHDFGVRLNSTISSVTNSGSITANAGQTFYYGVRLDSPNTILTNNAGAVINGGGGVYLGGAATVINSGQITGLNANGDGIQTNGALNLTNNAGATLSAGRIGVASFGAGVTLTNGGTISGNQFGGVYTSGGTNSITNLAGGTISGYGSANALNLRGAVTVDNSGAMTAVNGSSVYAANGGQIFNRAGGTISSTTSYGIYINAAPASGSTLVDNAGTINAGYFGVIAFGGGTLTNSGTVTAGGHGNALTLDGGGTVINLAGGILNATGASDAWGMLAQGNVAATLDNRGTINAGSGLVTNGSSTTILNSGIVNASASGVMTYGGAVSSLTNSGSISATDGMGVDFGAGGTVTNSGSISGGASATGSNYGVVLGGAGTVTNQSGGTISGGDGAILAGTDGAVTIALDAGSTTNGAVRSTGAGARTLDVNGALAGAYDASVGTGIDTVTLASTGSLAGASLGDADDSLTTLGGAISGNVDGGAGTDALAFDIASGTVTYGGNFTNFETGTKSGAGKVSLTGTNSVNTMLVNGGILAVNGSLTSTVTVNGGALGGNGTLIGGLTIASGGHLAPGNSIGTLHITGPLTFAAGSTYDVEIDPVSSDQTIATGAVTINGGTVNVLGTGTAYAPLTVYQIVQGSSVTGTFAGVTDNLAFLDPTLAYTATTVNLEMRRNDIDFADVAGNPNQAAVAGGVQSLGSGDLYDAVLVLDAASAQGAFDMLSGDIHPTTVAALAQQADRLRVAQLDQGAADGQGVGLWADASTGVGSLEWTDNGAAKATQEDRDILAGIRFANGGLSLVAGGGHSRLNVDQRRNDAHADVDSWRAGGQVGYRAGALRVMAGATWAGHDVDTARNVTFPGFAETLTANRDGTTRTVYGEIAYTADLTGLHLEPFAGAAWQKVSLDATTETGGDAALSIDRIKVRSTVTEVGIRFGGPVNASASGFYPVGTLAWQHLFGDDHADMVAAFEGGDAFAIHGAARSRDGLRANLGLGYRIGGANLAVSYDGRVSENDVDHSVRASVSIGF